MEFISRKSNGDWQESSIGEEASLLSQGVSDVF